METHGPRMDAERHRGIGLGFLLQHDLAGHDEAFMAAPGYAQLEELQTVGKRPDVDAVAEDEGEQAGRAGEPRGKAVGQPRVADLLDNRVILQAPCDFEGRMPDAPSCGSAGCAGPGSAARHRTARACRRDMDMPRRGCGRSVPSSLRPRRPRHRCGRRDIWRPNGRRGRRRATEAAGRPGSPSCYR